MKTKVLLFAHLKEIVGADEIFFDLEKGSKGKDVLDTLETEYPELKKHRHYLKLSMDGKYINTDTEITESSEIAVFPPVSGG